MPDLKYDTDAMRESAEKYKDIADDLEEVKEVLKGQITDLKEVYWKTDAGEAFMNMYEDTWAKNVDKYIAVLREMSGLLNRAARDYDSVTSKLKTVPEVQA